MTIDGDVVVEEASLFERGIHFYVFYCLSYVKDIPSDVLEEHVLKERDPDLNEEEYIGMKNRGDDHQRG